MKPFGGENAESYYDEGITASMRGDLNRAAECFETAVRKDSSMASAYQQLGRVYARLGRYPEAIRLLQQVVDKRPESAIPLVDLGTALLGAGRVDDARRAFERAFAIDPQNAKSVLGLAQADYDQGQWAAAMQHAQHAMTVGGATFPVVWLLGRAAQLSGQNEEANRSFQRADQLMEKYIESTADKPEGYYLRGEVAFFQKQYAKALDHFKAAQEHADDAKSYLAYGESFTKADILAKAGLCLQAMDELEQARSMGRRVLKLNPDHKIGQALRAITIEDDDE